MMTRMFNREPERLRLYLKYHVLQTRKLNPQEHACLCQLEKNKDERRKMAQSQIGVQHDASSRVLSGKTSASTHVPPTKRANEQSTLAPVAKKTKR